MDLEQRYHAGRLESVNRFVNGRGTVCGLGVTASVEGTGDDEVLEVTVDPGVALDCCGRVLVVDEDVSASLAVPQGENSVTEASVYLAYDECFAESVPVSGLEDACDEDCADNRTIEVTRVVLRAGAPPPDDYKSVAVVDVPSPEEVGDRLSTVGDAPSETVFLELHRPGTEEATAVELIKRGRSRGYLYNAGEESVSLGAGDVLVALDGRTYVVVEEQNLAANAGSVGPGATVYTNEDGLRARGFAAEELDGAEGGTSGESLSLTGSIPGGQVLGAYADGRGNQLIVEQKDPPQVVDLPFLTGLTEAELSIDPDTVVDSESDERILTSVARSYYEDAPLSTCAACGDSEELLLGSLTRAGGDPAWRAEDFERGPMVYSNDMLYAAVSRHATDYRNPHQVGLELTDGDGNAVLGVEGLQRGDGSVRFVSANDALNIDTEDGTVTFTVEASGGAAPDLSSVRSRLSDLERYALEKALRCNLVSFGYLTEQFPEGLQSVQNALQDVIDSIDTALNNPDTFADADSYITAMETILTRQQTLRSRIETPGAGLPSVASEQSLNRYEDALDRLGVTTDGDDPLAVAMAQECVGKAAELLVPEVGINPGFEPSFDPSDDVTVIDSLGDHYRSRLGAVRGVTTLEELADLSDDDIAEIADEIDRLSEERLREWVVAARKRLDRD